MTTILRKLSLLTFTLMLPMLTMAQSNLKMYFSYGIYADPQSGPYIEIYTKALASTLSHKLNADKTFGSGINIEYALMLGDTIKAHENYTILSPNLKDTNDIHFFVMDMHRSWASPGDYILKFVCKDINNPDIYNSASVPIQIRYNAKKATFGHLLILDTFYKSNKESSFTRDDVTYIPYVSTLHSMERKTISFYTELYNIEKFSGKMENITLQYYIKDLKGRIIPACEGFTKKTARSKMGFSGIINIANLPTGEYSLCVVARNEQRDILATTNTSFLRVNDPLTPGYDLGKNMFINIISTKDIADFSPFMDIVSEQDEIDNYHAVLKQKDTMATKKWFYEYWRKRDRYSAGKAYAEFQNRVDTVNKLYSFGKTKGYESDRGHTYLRYGPADRVSSTNASDSAYPYEIWTYNSFGSLGTVHFIFYRHTKQDNHFVMLHSDVKGFVHDPNWMDQIKAKAKNGYTEDKKAKAGTKK